MFKKLTIISTIALLSLTGCGKDAPKCSDERTTNLAIEIVKEQFLSMFTGGKEIGGITITTIRTIEHDKETGSYLCKGKITIAPKDETKPVILPITYKSESTDDGKEFYVSVIDFKE
jgi:hypothetical protein